MNYQILTGDNRITLKTLPDDSIDAIITDPPYGIDFLGKSWDANTGALETYQECLRVLKPGGHILAFSAARTYHHLAVTLEQAGFEIRDQIMWIYSSGFPKSQDIGKQIDKAAGKKDPNYGTTNNNGTSGGINLSFTEDHIGGSRRCNKCKKDVAAQYDCKEDQCGLKYNPQTEDGKIWSGWGTALKPAHEPIALARKPIKTSIRENCLKYGTGALNIDATRVPFSESDNPHATFQGGTEWSEAVDQEETKRGGRADKPAFSNPELGRFPSNVLGEIEGYQKYFYCPKVSRRERHIGHDNGSVPSHNEMAQAMGGSLVDHDGNPSVSGNKALIPGVGDIYTHSLSKHYDDWCKQNGHVFEKGNNHPTVKPIELMKYLIKLVTPPGGTVLDPFNGSGSTGCAAVELGHTYIGCELDPAYVAIAKKRIEAWYEHTRDPAKELFD